MQWPPVLEFLELYKREPTLLGGTPAIWHSEQVEGFTRPELGTAKSPLVALCTLPYKPEGFQDGLRGWSPVVAYAKSSEKGVLSYNVAKDVEHPNRITLVEAYESEEYLHGVHFKCAAVQQKLQEEEQLKAGEPDVVFLKHGA
jgi:quinol monooxygenase YgiN